jgi:hypothetical protein
MNTIAGCGPGVLGWVRIPARPVPSDMVSVSSVLVTVAVAAFALALLVVLAAFACAGSSAADAAEASNVTAASPRAWPRPRLGCLARGTGEAVATRLTGLNRKGTVDLRRVRTTYS